MGNGSSKKKYSVPASYYGGVFIKLDKEAFFPGETLIGNVYLNLENVYPGNKLYLSFKGYEFATFLEAVHRQTESGSSTEYHRREQKYKIFKEEREMYVWPQGNTISPGQYIFPFQFIIPQNLPSTFFFSGNMDSVAEIKYTLTAYLMPDQKSIPKLKHKAPITVREYPQTVIQSKQVTMTKNVTTCCCCNKGSISIKTTSEKDAYAPSEQVRLVSEIDNSKCKLAVENVRFYLIQRIFLNAHGRIRTEEFNIYKLDLGRIEPGNTCLGNQAKSVTIQLPPGQEGTAKDFVNEKGKKRLYDPKTAITPSTHGRLITSDYYLKIACKPDGCMCCQKDPNTELPILVYAPIFVRMPDPAPPMNWHPQQIAPVNLAWNFDLSAYGQGMYNNQNYAPNMMPNQIPSQNPGQLYAPSIDQAPIQGQPFNQASHQPYQASMMDNNINYAPGRGHKKVFNCDDR